MFAKSKMRLTPASSSRKMAPPKNASRFATTPRQNSDLYSRRKEKENGGFEVSRESDPVQVYCRVRPQDGNEEGKCVNIVDSTTLILTPPENSLAWKSGQAKEAHYKFQKIYDPNTSQRVMFDEIALPLVRVSFSRFLLQFPIIIFCGI